MKKVLSIILVLAFCFALVACAAPAATQEGTATTATAKARADKESVVIAIQGEPTQFDHQFASDDGNLRFISWNIFEPLVRLDGQTLEVTPVLATEWSQVDDLTWEFKLREGVKFHDGDTFDAEDVAFSVNRVVDPTFNAQLLSSIDTIDHAEVVDTYTVRVVTKAADPILLKRLSLLPIYSKQFTEGKDAKALAVTANGTAPYQFGEWKAGDFVSITAFDGYWGEKPVIKNAKFRFIEERLTALSGLQAGEIDLAVNMYPEYIADIPKPISQVSNESYWVRFNQLVDGTFKSLDNRMAASYALQTEGYAEALFAGYATPLDGQMGREGYTGYTASVKSCGYDLEKAKELVAKSGYAGEEVELVSERGRWLKDGEVTEAIAADLSAAGFNVTTKFLAWNEWLDTLFDKVRTPDLFFSSNGNDFFDVDRPLSICASSEGNQSATLPSEWDAKIKAAQSEMDPAARQAMYDEINKHFNEDPFAMYALGADALYGAAADLEWNARKDTLVLVSEMVYAG